MVAITQLVVHTLKIPINMNGRTYEDINAHTKHGTLTAVSDPAAV